LADSLDAVVAADNTVATLMLETGMGTFVRYGGDWQLLRDDSGSLDDMGLVSVAPGALDVWDAADSAGQTISVFDLPLKGDDGEAINPEDTSGRGDGGGHRGQRGLDPADRLRGGPGPGHPVRQRPPRGPLVRDQAGAGTGGQRADPGALERGPVAVAPPFALAGGRWSCSRCSAARPRSRLPPGCSPTCARRGSPARRDVPALIAAARVSGMLHDPYVLTASKWQDWLHPRGKDGRFIEKGKFVNIFANPNALLNDRTADRRRARITELRPEGAFVSYQDIHGNPLPPTPAPASRT
jgi:hypothetical protein